jgi:hypothetical protein
MPRIAISYRRSDSAAMAGRIFDRLTSHYGKHQVFMDVNKIPIGVDFRAHIDETLRRTDVVLALIGADWLGPRGDGPPRILDRDDPVRVEIETALARRRRVIPVLLDGAKMPDGGLMPPSFGEFAFLNAAEAASGKLFDAQVERLIAAIDRAAADEADKAASIYASSRMDALRRLAADVARYFVAPLTLPLVAHFLIVLSLDLNLIYLKLVSAIAPALFGVWFSQFSGRGTLAACGFALALGVASTAGMTILESLATGDPLLPHTVSG